MVLMKKFLQAVLVGFVITSLFMCQPASAQDVKTYIHPRAIELYPSLRKDIPLMFPELQIPAYPLALIEHESCITLKHSKCFNINAELKTYWADGSRREHGLGLGQFTRAWRNDGMVRLDTLAALKKMYPQELAGITWETMAKSADQQVLLALALLKDDYKNLYVFKDPIVRLQATDSAYNGGRRDVLSARKVCGLQAGCNPDIWFDNIEKHCVKSRQALYGGRSPCDINTHHVRDVFKTRLPKFQKSFKFHSTLGIPVPTYSVSSK